MVTKKKLEECGILNKECGSKTKSGSSILQVFETTEYEDQTQVDREI